MGLTLSWCIASHVSLSPLKQRVGFFSFHSFPADHSDGDPLFFFRAHFLPQIWSEWLPEGELPFLRRTFVSCGSHSCKLIMRHSALTYSC